MARRLKSSYGMINLLKHNPRKMSDNAYMKLRDSLDRDPYMLEARGVVLWQVPSKLEAKERNGKSPFSGQEGQLVCLGGNQRCRVLLEQGYEEIPDTWVRLAKKPDGEWWDEEAAERFVLLDNNPEGIAGENDYDVMIADFNERMMAAAGIDFSNFPVGLQSEMTDAGIEGLDGEDGEGGVEDEVEKGPHGERDPELEEWIQKRENTRRDLPELMETGFYLCLVFETHGQKMEFLEKAGMTDKVEYEMFTDGVEFSKHVCGIEIERSGLHFPDMRRDSRLAELAEPNDQEPKGTATGDDGAWEAETADESDLLDAVKELLSDRREYEEVISWLKAAETGGGGLAKPPAEVSKRLQIYREWAEEALERTNILLEASEAEEREKEQSRKGRELAEEQMDKARKEREALGMLGGGEGEAEEDEANGQEETSEWSEEGREEEGSEEA